MLVLSRKLSESVIIDGDIEIVILGVENDTVKLGIRAPKEIDIYRKEIYEAIQSSNREAAQAQLPIDRLTEFLKKQSGGQGSE